jgi:hypothetical protein
MSWLCKDCGYETDNHTEYKLHIETHAAVDPALGLVPKTATETVLEHDTSITPEPDASKTVDKEHKPTDAPWSKEAQAKQARGIVLEYRFDGLCPDCNNPVTTLELPNLTAKDKVAMVAFCVHCKQQLQTEVVAKL